MGCVVLGQRGEDIQGYQHGMEVEVLAWAGQVHSRQQVPFKAKCGHVRSEHQGSSNRRGHLLENRSGFGIPNTYDCRHYRFENPCFLAGDSSPCGTEQGAVVQADRGNHRQGRHNYVRAVQPAAKTCFNHRGIHSLTGKPPECHPGSNLKERQPVKLFFI